ncbi:MAG: lipoprotein signal peptidase [Bacteroidales bacterium]|jgi:signal peptidase II|nr:lipoprotein signal peptidase [Bacteroidales bacterium]
MTKLSNGKIALLVIFFVLLCDQILKIWIKTNLVLYEDVKITSWFILRFVENAGMAFGIEVIGKLFLSLFRIVAVVLIGYYLISIIKQGVNAGFVVCLSLILAGALGNILDSAFYGIIFSESLPSSVAELFPSDGGYAPFLHGKVVDMFYFPLIEIEKLPDWVPFWGGGDFVFFRFIFNIADAAVSVGVGALLIFERKHLVSKSEETKSNA